MKIKKILKWLTFLLVVISIAGFAYYKSQNKGDGTEYVVSKVIRGDLKQTVSATGVVKPLAEVDLSFSSSGRINEILVSTGDEIKKDFVVVKQDDSSLLISEKQAQANLQSAIASLNQMKAGASNEDIQVAEQNVTSSQVAYDNAIKNLESLRTKTIEDIRTAEKNVSSAQTTLQDKKTNLADIKNKYSQNIKNLEQSAGTMMSSHLFTADSSLDLVDKALTDNGAFEKRDATGKVSQLKTDYLNFAFANYDQAVVMLEVMRLNTDSVKLGTTQDVSAFINQSINTLDEAKKALNNSFIALQNTIPTSSYLQSNIDANKVELNTKQIVVEAAISELQTKQQNLINANIDFDNQVNIAQALVNTAEDNSTSAKINLSSAEASRDLQISGAESDIDSALARLNLSKSELSFKKAPPRRVDLASQEAQVQQFSAALSLVQDGLDKTQLVSPMDGIVIDVLYKVGEQVVANSEVVKLISDHNYAIEVDISESDIAKVKMGDKVSVSFDSLGDESLFDGEVVFIDPAQTVISDVVYYTIKIILNNSVSSLVKPGMTANVGILTDKKDNVIMIPQRAILRKNGQRYVRVLQTKGKQQIITEVDTALGLYGDDGLVEVITGLQEGQDVVTFVKNAKE